MKRLYLLALCVALCLCCVLPAQAGDEASLALDASSTWGYGGDEITVSIRMTANAMGGLQTNLTWNDGYLTYVEGSAAFAASFQDAAMIAQINAQENCLRLVYACPTGYSARDEVIFTAKFRLSEGTNGTTAFSLTGTKLTDASVNAMTVSVQDVSVYTQEFNPGTAYVSLACPDSADMWPAVGDTITVQLSVVSYDSTVGSVQGVIEYDPALLQLETNSAAFTDAAETAAFTKSLNTSQAGKIQFVYASMDGVPDAALMEMRFKVVSAQSACIALRNVKATNAEINHLEQMICWPSDAWIYPQTGSGQVNYTLVAAPGSSCADDSITLMITAQGAPIGGMQGTLTYDASQLEYVPRSAAFADEFAAGADVKMINDAKAGQIKLVYANTAGYIPNGNAIFTVQFRVKAETNLTPVELTALKTTNPGGTDVQEIGSAFVQGVDWENLTAGHSWDAGIVTRKPTTTAEGSLTYTCTVCKATRTEQIPVRVPGDANEDGKVGLEDILLVLEYDSGKSVRINLYNADVNQDGKADLPDALQIMQYIAGWDVMLK